MQWNKHLMMEWLQVATLNKEIDRENKLEREMIHHMFHTLVIS